MGPIDRRDFLKVSVGSIGAAAVASGLPGALVARAQSPAASGPTAPLSGKIRVLNTAALDPLQTPTDTNPHTPTELKRLADEYMAAHPGTEIEFVKWPGGEYWNTTLNTWLAGGTAPDVLPLFYHLAPGLANQGLVLDLEPYLDQPNPYIEAGKPGSAAWRDQFVPNYGATAAPDGKHYTVIFDANWVATFTNQDLLASVGAKAPTTWAELMDACAKLQAAGHIPYSTIGPWIAFFIQSMLWSEKAKEIRLTPVEGFKEITTEEMARAYKKGIFTPKDPLWKEAHRIFQDLAQYMSPGASAYARDYYLGPDFNRLFLTGQAAMQYDLGSLLEVVASDTQHTFETGYFFVPEITKETSEYATGARVGSVIFQGDAMWAVPAASPNKDLAIDWLRYISVPDRMAKVVLDGTGGTFPMINGYEDPQFPAFQEQLDLGFYYIYANNYGPVVAEEYNFRLLPQLIDRAMTVDQFADAVDASIAANIDKLIADNKWDTSAW